MTRPTRVADVPRFATVVLVDADGRVLLQERDEHAPIDPDRWGFVGGHVDPGEDDEQAAYRELAEEAGVHLAPGTLTLWREALVWHDHYGSHDPVQVWTAPTALTDADLVCGEGRQVCFVPADRVPHLPLTGSATLLLPALLADPAYDDLRTAARTHPEETP